MITTDTSSDLQIFLIFLIVRLRQEEKRQQEETNRVKERKRKREKYAEKVSQASGGWQGPVGDRAVLTKKALGTWLIILVTGWYPAPAVYGK